MALVAITATLFWDVKAQTDWCQAKVNILSRSRFKDVGPDNSSLTWRGPPRPPGSGAGPDKEDAGLDRPGAR